MGGLSNQSNHILSESDQDNLETGRPHLMGASAKEEKGESVFESVFAYRKTLSSESGFSETVYKENNELYKQMNRIEGKAFAHGGRCPKKRGEKD